MKLNFKALVCFGFYIIRTCICEMIAAAVAAKSLSCASPCSVSCSTESSCSATTKCGNAICKTKLLPFSQGDNRARDYAAVAAYQYLADPR